MFGMILTLPCIKKSVVKPFASSCCLLQECGFQWLVCSGAPSAPPESSSSGSLTVPPFIPEYFSFSFVTAVPSFHFISVLGACCLSLLSLFLCFLFSLCLFPSLFTCCCSCVCCLLSVTSLLLSAAAVSYFPLRSSAGCPTFLSFRYHLSLVPIAVYPSSFHHLSQLIIAGVFIAVYPVSPYFPSALLSLLSFCLFPSLTLLILLQQLCYMFQSYHSQPASHYCEGLRSFSLLFIQTSIRSFR